MQKIKTIALSIVTLLALSAQAYSSDNKSQPYYTSLKIGGGFNKIKLVDIDEDSFFNKNARGLVGAFAFGYLQNNVRLEGEFYIDNGIEAKKGNNVSKAEKQTTAGFVNFYYDFRNNSQFIPYIMGGVGLAFTKARFDYTSPVDNSVHHYKGKRSSGLASKVGIGISYKASNTTSIDLGYQLMNTKHKQNINTNVGNVADKVSVKSSLTHLVLVGCRFSF